MEINCSVSVEDRDAALLFLLEAYGWRLPAWGVRGVWAASACFPDHIPPYSEPLMPTPAMWQRSKISQEGGGTILLRSLALCSLALTDDWDSPFRRFPSLGPSLLQPLWQPSPRGPTFGVLSLSWLILLYRIWKGCSAFLLSDMAELSPWETFMHLLWWEIRCAGPSQLRITLPN